MTRTKRIVDVLAIVGMVMTLPACGVVGDAATAKTKNDITQVLLGYSTFEVIHNKPPTDAKEFSEWASKCTPPDASVSFAKLEAQGYKVYWGTETAKLPGASSTVLIHPGDAATKGGIVGMADFTVTTMTAAEFNAAAKPTPPIPK